MRVKYLVGIFGLAATLIAAPSPASKAKSSIAEEILLIGNKGENSLSFVDLTTGKEQGRVPTGHMPHEIAVSPDGRQAAVVAYGGKSIDIFDVISRGKLRTIDLTPNERPHGLVWLPDGRLVATTEKSQSITVVDTNKGDRLTSIKTDQPGSHMLVIDSSGSRAYTANIPAGTVTVIDLENGRKVRDIEVGGKPEAIALTTDGRTLWVGDLERPRAQAFDTGSFERLAEVETGAGPIRLLPSPDGRWIVSSNFGSGSLTVIDAKTRKVEREVTVSGSNEAGQLTILFSQDGGRLYAAETARDVIAEIDFATGQVLRRLPAGKNGDGLAIAPGV